MEILAIVVVALGGFAAVILQTVLHAKEKREIFDRYMAGDYRMYKYYQEENPIAVELMKKKAEANLEKKDSPEDVMRRAKASGM